MLAEAEALRDGKDGWKNRIQRSTCPRLTQHAAGRWRFVNTSDPKC